MPPTRPQSAPRRRRATYGETVRQCYQGVGMTQVKVAAAAAQMSPAEYPGVTVDFASIDQSNLSRWVTDKMKPSPEQLAALEIVCGRPLGWCLGALGFVEIAGSVPEAVALDGRLSEEGRRVLLAAWEALVDLQ